MLELVGVLVTKAASCDLIPKIYWIRFLWKCRELEIGFLTSSFGGSEMCGSWTTIGQILDSMMFSSCNSPCHNIQVVIVETWLKRERALKEIFLSFISSLSQQIFPSVSVMCPFFPMLYWFWWLKKKLWHGQLIKNTIFLIFGPVLTDKHIKLEIDVSCCKITHKKRKWPKCPSNVH